MCGLFGAISESKLVKSETWNAMQLGIFSTPRGMHSTGLALGHFKGDKKKKVHLAIRKDTQSPSDFVFNDQVLADTTNENFFFYMGHNRQATVGDISVRNAHPFISGPIVGAHNGTINSYKDEFIELDGKKTQLTDSEQFIRNIAETSLEETVEDLGYTDAFAVSYFDRRDMTFNLSRNDQRPLHIMRDVGSGTMYWASLKESLELLKATSGLKCTVEYIPAWKHYSWKMKTLNATIRDVKRKVWSMGPTDWTSKFRPPEDKTSTVLTKEDVCLPKAAQLLPDKGEREIPFQNLSAGSPPLQSISDEALNRVAEKIAARHNAELAKNHDVNGLYKYYDGKHMSCLAAGNTLGYGCAGCKDVSTIEDPVWWFTANDYVCDECFSKPFIKDSLHGKKCWLSLDLRDVRSQHTVQRMVVMGSHKIR